MKLSTKTLSAHGLMALVLLALLSVPFAHRAGAAPATPDLRLFIAMGGSLSDICGESGRHAAGGCESCVVVGVALLPKPDLPLDPTFAFRTRLADPPLHTATLQKRPYDTPCVRAPPRQ